MSGKNQNQAKGTNSSNLELSSLVNSAFQGKFSITSPRDNGSHTLLIGPSELGTKHMAKLLLDVAYEYDNHVNEELTVDKVAEYLEWVYCNRINYVKAGKNEVHPRSVEYPTICYDSLAAIRKYDGGSIDGIQINPELSQALQDKWLRNDRVKELEGHEDIARMLKVAGVKMSLCLPLDRTTTDRTWFEMAVGERVTTSGVAPSMDQVFSRTMYQFEALTTLFGVQKLELILTAAIKSAMYDIVRRYVSNRTAGK